MHFRLLSALNWCKLPLTKMESICVPDCELSPYLTNNEATQECQGIECLHQSALWTILKTSAQPAIEGSAIKKLSSQKISSTETPAPSTSSLARIATSTVKEITNTTIQQLINASLVIFPAEPVLSEVHKIVLPATQASISLRWSREGRLGRAKKRYPPTAVFQRYMSLIAIHIMKMGKQTRREMVLRAILLSTSEML